MAKAEKFIELNTKKYSNETRITIGRKRNIKHWLQSIKERYTWKPSDAQMKALDSTAGIVGILTPTGANLRSLYKDLEKLKGE